MTQLPDRYRQPQNHIDRLREINAELLAALESLEFWAVLHRGRVSGPEKLRLEADLGASFAAIERANNG